MDPLARPLAIVTFIDQLWTMYGHARIPLESVNKLIPVDSIIGSAVTVMVEPETFAVPVSKWLLTPGSHTVLLTNRMAPTSGAPSGKPEIRHTSIGFPPADFATYTVPDRLKLTPLTSPWTVTEYDPGCGPV
ncbi:hypothetical protein AB0C02_25005 [Micromonospora sp. NPDC048999]|uniref:hypothetical protein n=1 Tax=Micromonospora sp. NPDC048999 TaxID=3155391 RepID=UPI0033E0D2D5